MQLTGKDNLIIGLGFLIVGLFLILTWQSNENVYTIGWIATIFGGIIGILGFVNVVFEKPNLIPQDFSLLTDNGIELKINRFPAFGFLLMPGSLLIVFTVMQAIKKEFDAGFWILFSGLIIVLYFDLGWLTMKYVLYPDRIKIRNIFKSPLVKEIFFKDLITVRTLTKSQENDRLAEAKTSGKDRLAQDVALLIFSFAKQGNYGSVILQTKNEEVELGSVRYPNNLVNIIKQLKGNN